METFEFQIKESKIIDNLFYEYYNHSSQINYICNKTTFNTPCSICLDKLEYEEKRKFKCGHYRWPFYVCRPLWKYWLSCYG